MVEAGDKAPDFNLEGSRGEQVSLAELTAEAPALLAFFRVDCPVCQLTWPFLERLHQAVPSTQLRVVGISQDDASETNSFAQEFGSSFPLLLDRGQSGYAVSNAYGVYTVPSLFLVERGGTVSWSSGGFVKADLEELGSRFGVSLFRQEDHVPAWKAG